MKIFKPKFWNKKNNLISIFLLPISYFLQLLVILKKIFIKKENFNIPVICVGNIYLGGTGKTPLTIEIVNMLEKLNKRTAIVKKFYTNHYDEFKLIESEGLALFKDVSRSSSIKKAIKNKFECVVLDDGFQDCSIKKNLTILCFNERQLIGNEMTLPSGPLREPLSSLRKTQIVVINGSKNSRFEEKIKNISDKISIYYSSYSPDNIEEFKDLNLLAFAGIGNPENFFYLLEKNKLHLGKKISFPDHYNYDLKDLNKLIDFSIKNNLTLITTEKDYFRIKHYNLPQIKYLSVNLKIENKEKLEKEIINIYDKNC